VEEAVNECNFEKGIGPDGFDGRVLLTNKDLRAKVCNELTAMLNNGCFPEYFLNGRLVPLSKKPSSKVVEFSDIIPIVIKPHLTKICEKAVLIKIKQIDSKLLDSDSYQAGFKEGRSCHNNMAAVLSRLKHQKRFSSQRGIAVFVDL
jgi:hypothetical protein